MRAFVNINPASIDSAVEALQQARKDGRRAVVSGGGSDLLGMMKERLILPDVVVNLKAVPGIDRVTEHDGGVRIGGLITLDALSRHAAIRDRYPVLAEAAGQVGTPQIRNTGTLAGNVCQRPWCWYFRNGFPCYKNGGDHCFAASGQNQHHAIFGRGPSYIVHPSDTAPALVALDAGLHIAGQPGPRVVPAAAFFVMPGKDPARENVLGDDEILTGVTIPAPSAGHRSTYVKLLDRESWTHALVSVALVLEMDRDVCRRARLVLGGVAPIPLDRPRAAALLEGSRVTSELAAKVADVAVEDARPLAMNGYKIRLTRAVVRRTVLSLGQRSSAEVR
jgi:xanthine dehydrogenase YagS FAD-binding subunit